MWAAVLVARAALAGTVMDDRVERVLGVGEQVVWFAGVGLAWQWDGDEWTNLLAESEPTRSAGEFTEREQRCIGSAWRQSRFIASDVVALADGRVMFAGDTTLVAGPDGAVRYPLSGELGTWEAPHGELMCPVDGPHQLYTDGVEVRGTLPHGRWVTWVEEDQRWRQGRRWRSIRQLPRRFLEYPSLAGSWGRLERLEVERVRDGDDRSVVVTHGHRRRRVEQTLLGVYHIDDVWALSDTDVWLVGSRFIRSGRFAPYVAHFDGDVWAEVALPVALDSLPDRAGLRSVWARGPDEVWVAGSSGLVWRYDGDAFHAVEVPWSQGP